MSNIKLKPCPFCGGEAKVDEVWGWSFVRCNSCYASSDPMPTEPEAAEKWNRRAQPDNPPQPLSESTCQSAPDKIIRGLLDLARYSEQESKDYVDADDPDDPFLRDAAVLREAARLLKQMQADMDNPPLTLEELRVMGGEPYWHVSLNDASHKPHWALLPRGIAKRPQDYGYGVDWLAYRHNPGEATS